MSSTEFNHKPPTAANACTVGPRVGDIFGPAIQGSVSISEQKKCYDYDWSE